MRRNKVISADAAAGLVLAGDTIATTGSQWASGVLR